MVALRLRELTSLKQVGVAFIAYLAYKAVSR